jgi:hypothetical protein
MLNLRSLSVSVLAGVFFFALVLHSQEAPVPSIRITSPVSDLQLIKLKGTVHPLANAQNDRGVAPDSLPLDRLHIILKRSESQDAALKQLLAEQHAPGSANFHKWLTPDEFGKRFGPSDQDIATVQTWLASKGFNVLKVSPGKLTMEVSGSVAQLRSAFHTQIHQYVVNGETHYANASDPQIPSALAPVVGGFVSLNNFRPRAASRKLGAASYDTVTHSSKPSWTNGSANSPSYVLAPQDYYLQYDLSKLYANGIDGTGQSIAIINEANINVALVNQFRSLFSLPYNPPQVIIDGNDPGIDGNFNPDGPNGASVESYLDVEWAGAVAPKATVYLVIAADTALSLGLELAAERAVFSNIAPVISLSFQGCEFGLGSENAFIYQLWEQAAAQGITVMVSSGDAGSAQCDNDNTASFATGGQAVNGFASTPWNVAVGGTDFYYSNYNGTRAALNSQLATHWNTTPSQSPAQSIQQVIPEQPWNDSQFGLNATSLYNYYGYTTIAGSGGGASSCSLGTYDSSGNTTSCSGGYGKPAWQTLNISGTEYVPSDGVRDLPDVSLFAADGLNYTYYPICAVDGDCQPATGTDLVQIYGVGGTSASSPAFAGIMALVNQQTGMRQGQANAVLYPMKAQFPSAFHEVTSGTNSVPCAYAPTATPNCLAVTSPVIYNGVTEGQIGTGTTPSFNASAGYNLATGLGTIDAYNLVMNWSSVKLAGTTTTLALNPIKSIYNHGDSITFSGNVTQSSGSGTPVGNVALMTDNSEQAQQGQPAQQAQNGFPLTAGAYAQVVTTLPGGTYNVWTQYGGDSTNAASSSAKTQITVNSEASGIDFYAYSIGALGGDFHLSPTPVSVNVDYGMQLDLQALVAPSSQLTALDACITTNTGCFALAFTMPTGTVTFTDNGTTILNVASINAQGVAAFNAPFKVGSHSVTASFAGDKSYNASTASPITFTVLKDTPYITFYTPLVDSINGTNQPTVLSVQVENYAQANSTSFALTPVAAPTGTITYTSSPSGISGSVTLAAGTDPHTAAVEGVGNIVIPAGLAAGKYTLTTTYSGDANYNSESGSFILPVVGISGLSTTTTGNLTGSLSPTTTLTLSGTVVGQTGHGAPTSNGSTTGVVLFTSSDGTNYNTLAFLPFSSSTGVTSTFTYTVNSTMLAQGANYITAQYTGDATYAPSAVVLNSGNAIANPLTDFTLVPTTTNLPVPAGTGATDVVQIASINGFSGTVNLTCTAAAGVSCSIANNAGLSANGSTTATLTVAAQAQTANQSYNVLLNATDAATGKYVHTLGINAVVTGSSAGTQSFALTAGTTNLSLDQSNSINNVGTSTITVTPLGGFTGSVAMSCAVSPAGANSPACTIATPVTLGSAQTTQLTVTTSATTAGGNYTVTVTATSGSITITTPVSVTVGASSFSLTNTPITVTPKGSSATGTITLTPSNGFTGTVNLSCVVSSSPSGVNDPVTCGIPSSVVISSTSAQAATLTIYSTAATAMLHPTKLFWPAGGGTALAMLCFLGLGKKRRGWMQMLGVLVLLLTAATVGCSSSISSSGGGVSSNPGTTSGAYTVTVTATSGSITQTTQVTVTVN